MSRQVALITGAGSGIGRGVARRLGRDGMALAVFDINEAGVQETIRLLGTDVESLGLTGDVTSEQDIKRMVEATVAKFGRIDALVTSAGVNMISPVIETELASWNRILNINLTGTFLACREVAPHMIKQRSGRIVTIGSVNGKDGIPLTAAYCASKHGVLGFTNSLGSELAPYGITVNSVCPGPVETDMIQKTWEVRANRAGVDVDTYNEKILRSIPLGRLTQTEDVAGLVAFLISPDASYITRTCIDVSGGARVVCTDDR